MNEQHRLNGSMIRDFLKNESRKQSYLVKQLGISQSLVAQMLGGHVPQEDTLNRLAQLMGVTEQELLIPKEAQRTG